MDELPARSVQVNSQYDSTFIVSTIPLRDHEGRPIAGIEIYRDVTAEGRIQDRYKALLQRERERAETLEEQVRARTADLQQSLEELERTRDQLVQSEKMSSLGRLVAGLAHELNNPVNFIYGNATFLKSYVNAYRRVLTSYAQSKLSEGDASRVQEARQEEDLDFIDRDIDKVLDAIVNGAERASGIIQDLRKFIRGESAAFNDLVDVGRAVEGTVNLAQPEFRERVSIQFTCDEGDHSVRGNEGKLNQVIMNLVMNAVQAIEGAGEIDITVQSTNDGVAVAVADTGPGIKASDLPHIFEPFFTTKPVGKGTGLGLSISYSIVEAHGGTLSAENRDGGGAVFRLWLPSDPST
jgi:signal transduction histidine kinase